MPTIPVPDLIEKKASGQALDEADIESFVKSVFEGQVDDAQLGAFLMTVFLNDMTAVEMRSLTHEMTQYGDRLHWSDDISALMVDKHSTGGVGDKISLVLAPAVAACGAKVPMISGRGLGFTGGTLDKLEAIPGYTVELGIEGLKRVMTEVGVFIAGQTANLAPVDKKMYAVRDRTATVDSLPLIVGSIMSKKAVEGLRGLVLDIKVGSSALMRTRERARQLAEYMIEVGEAIGISTTAVLTHMSRPIGRCIGNALEVIDALWALNGHASDDLRELVEVEGAHMLLMSGVETDLASARRRLASVIADGSALAKFGAMLKAQGVSAAVADALCRPGQLSVSDYLVAMGRAMPQAREVVAATAGLITEQDALALGKLTWKLGAGRSNKTDKLDYEAGVHLLKKVGERVNAGECWAVVYHNKPLPADFDDICQNAITVEAKEKLDHQSMIIETVTKDNLQNGN